MATLKLKHLLLYALCFILFIFTQMPGGALISLFLWMQIALLLWQKNYNFKNQIYYFNLFLTLIPTVFVWGSVVSFIEIYSKESHVLFILAYSIVNFAFCYLFTVFGIFNYAFCLPEEPLLLSFKKCISEIKNNKLIITYVSILVFLTTLVHNLLSADYRIILGVVLAHLFLRQEDFFRAVKQKN